MRRQWLKSLYRSWGIRKTVRRRRGLHLDALEDRAVPATVSFQQGVLPLPTYADGLQTRIESQLPNSNSTAAAYLITSSAASTTATTSTSIDLLRFGKLFVSEGGSIPDGSTITSAVLRYVTANTNELADSSANSYYAVSQLLTPFDASTTWNSFGMTPMFPESSRIGPVFGVQTNRAFNDVRIPDLTKLNPPSLVGLNSNATGGNSTAGIATYADVTGIVQNWSDNPASNFGFMTRNAEVLDTWGLRSNTHPFTADRPMLTITFDPPPAAIVKTTSFQQGVDGYSNTTSIWMQGEGNTTFNVTTDGNTLILPEYLDGFVSTGGSGDDQMLIRFDKIFGEGPGQIPSNATILSAGLDITTGAVLDDAAVRSNGMFVANQILFDWNTTTKYLDPVLIADGINGPTMLTGSKQPNTDPSGTIAAVVGNSSTELTTLSIMGTPSADNIMRFDIKAAVQAWVNNPANNKGINIQTAGTADGWLVHFPGSLYVSSRPKLVVRYSVPAVSEPANNAADLAAGTLTFRGGAGVANQLNIDLNAGIYTLTDPSGIIDLNQASKDAGWTGSGTNSISGPASSIADRLAVNTGTGDDTVTISGLASQFVLDGGGQANDKAVINGSLSTGDKQFAIAGVGSITSAAGKLINAGATGIVSLTASNGIGTAGQPIPTQAFGVKIVAGNGGAFVAESDGAFVSANVTGTGTLSVTSQTGTLTVGANEVIRTASGAITLSSGDGITIDGNLGVSAKTGAGLITLNANTDGAGTEGFTSNVRSNIATSGNVTINVNTPASGTGSAALGITSIGGTLTVAAFGGNIVWSAGYGTSTAETVFNAISGVAAKAFVFSASGIGSAARPIQAFSIAGTDALNSSTLELSAGGGGIFFTTFGQIDTTVKSAVTTNGGVIRIATANYGTATTAATNTHNLFVDGPVTSDSGAINLLSNDNLTLTANAAIGGAGFTGTVMLHANTDAQFVERLLFQAGSSILTTNSSPAAVLLKCSGNDPTATDSVSSGVTLGNVTVGDGGTITVLNTEAVVIGTTTLSSGNITQLPGTTLNAGSGKIVLSTRSRLNGAATLPPSAGIGTSAQPITITASSLDVTGTNSPVFVTGTSTMTITAAAVGRSTLTAGLEIPLPPATISIATSAGQLIVGGLTQTDGGTLTLSSTSVGGGIVVNSQLGDATTGPTVLNAGTNSVAFNANFTTFAGVTTTFTTGAGKPVNLGPLTTNNGSISASSGLEVGGGETFGGTGTISGGALTILANGFLAPATASTAGFIATRNLTATAGGILNLNLNNTTAGTGHDQVKVTGQVDVSGALLRLVVAPSVTVGQVFTILDNDTAIDGVTGQFVGGTSIRGFNNPLYTFSINYAGGDGNDIVATVTDINTASALLDVQGNQVIYYSNLGISNVVVVSQGATKYTIAESGAGATSISLTTAAVSAGWTGGGTLSVSGPFAGVTGLTLGLSDGLDTITALNAGVASISVSGTGTLTLSGAAVTASSFSLDEFTAFLLDGSIAAGTGIAFTGQNGLIFSGTGSAGTTNGNISVTRSGDISVSGPPLNAVAGSISITGTVGTTTTLNGFNATTPAFTVSGSANVAVNGVINTSGTMTITAATAITDAAPGRLGATVLTLTSPAIGDGLNPVVTKATTIIATATTNGVFLKELDGATVTPNATGAGQISIVNDLGLLILTGTMTTGSGQFSVESKDGLQLDGVLGGTGFSGRLILIANSDGAGPEGFTHTVGASWRTVNQGEDAASITVNTPAGGTGNAVLGASITGVSTTNGSGKLTVNANKASILWNPGYGTVSGGTLPDPVGGTNPTATIMIANDLALMVDPLDGGSIGTLDTPIQAGAFAANVNVSSISLFTLVAGTGGIYLTEWRDEDPTIVSATAKSGDIQIFTGNAGDARLFVTGTVFTGAGNIWLAADDNLDLTDGTIGGPTFAGTIRLEANRDAGNEQRIQMGGNSSVETTNTGPAAIQMLVAATDNNQLNTTIGGITVGRVKAGSGATILLDAATSVNKQGNINQIFGTAVDAGEGTIILNARNLLNGPNLAVGAGIYHDLDGTGANKQALQVRAKNVVVTATNTDVWLAESTGVVIPDDGFVANGFNLTGTVTGPGFLKASTDSGLLNVLNATTDISSVTLTSSGAGGGITLTGPLADADTGTITLDAGPNAITFLSSFTTPAGKNATFIAGTPVTLGPTTTITNATTITAANGLSAGSGRTLTGSGTAAAPVAIAAGGSLVPGSSPGTITTGNLSLAGIYAIEVNGTAAGSFDRTIVNGTVDLTGATLAVSVNGTLSKNDTILVIDNDGTGDAVIGTFANGPNFLAINDPRYVFTVNTAGGDGNDVVLTVADVQSNLLHVTPGGVIQLATDNGVNDGISVDIVGPNYVVSDSGTPITLTAGAVTAGWTGSGTNTVTGPVAGVTGLSLALSNGTDVISKLIAGVPANINGLGTLAVGGGSVGGSLTVAGPSTLTFTAALGVAGNLSLADSVSIAVQDSVLATGTVNVSNVTNVTGTAAGLLGGSTMTINASNGIGASGNPLNTKGDVLNLTAGDGGIFVNEADGAGIVPVTTSLGVISISNVSGTLTAATPISTGSSISLFSGDSLTVDTTLGSASYDGTITLAANTDGAGTQGFMQTLNGSLQTANTTATAASITVNTAGGGTGDALLGVGSIGSNTGGTITVQTHGGSALWNTAFGVPASPDTGSNTFILRAHDYVFAASGAGSIGTELAPIQTDNYATFAEGGFSTIGLTAGSGGIYFWDWGSNDFKLTGAIATGGGNVQVVAANAGDHDIYLTGNMTTGSGRIELWINDELFVSPGTVIGGPGFSGTVNIVGNRDKGTAGQPMIFDATSSILTSNASNTAVVIQMYGDGGTPSPVTLSNITVGDGGTISVDVAPEAEAGQILVQPGTKLNAGATGTVKLNAGLTTGSGDIIGTSATPLATVAGNIIIAGVTGDIWISESDGANISGAHSGSAGTVRFTSTAGALTVAAPLQSNGGTISLNAAGGITIADTLGDANTGIIAINGPLTGAGTIALGTGDLTLTQATAATFSGDITGTKNFINQSIGTLTLSGTINLTGAVTGKNGTTVVTGTLAAPANVSTAASGTLAGTGTIVGPVTTAGTLSPGVAGAGTLNTGSINFITNGIVAIDLLGSTPALADRVSVTGAVSLGGAKLVLNAPNPITIGTKFTIIDNDSTDSVAGTFQGLAEGTNFVSGGKGYSITYTGGSDNNDVIVTFTDVVPPLLDVTPAGLVRFTSDVAVNDALSVSISGANYVVTNATALIGLTAAAKSAGWTGHNTNSVTGPTAGVSGIVLDTSDGADTISLLTTGVPTVIGSTGTLTFSGPATVTGGLTVAGPSLLALQNTVTATTVSMTGAGDITATAAAKVTGTTITLGASNSLGTVGSPISTQAGTLILGAGDGGVFVTETDSVNLAATATNAGPITVSNLAGNLTVTGLVSTGSGAITLSSPNALIVDSDIGSGTFIGILILNTNTDGVGSDGYTQTVNGSITTGNTTTAAATITVNTAIGGTGDAILGVGSIGTNSGGTLTVQPNGRNILWNSGFTLPATPYGAVSNSSVLKAHDYEFATSGASSIGTAAFPIQTDNFATTDAAGGNTMNLTAGTGGIFLWDWGTNDLTVNSAITSGGGNIQIATANAAANNLAITGNVSAAGGNIEIWSDDSLTFGAGVTVGGAGFSGTISIHGNRDIADTAAQPLTMNATTAVSTTNATANAVEIIAHGVATTTPAVITLANVAVGNGGTITVNARPETGAGRIAALTGTSLNTGATGVINLTAGLNTTATSGDVIGTTAIPIATTAANISFTVETGGNVRIVEADDAKISGSDKSTLPAAVVAVTSTAGALTVASPLETDSAGLTLTAAGGVIVPVALGDADTGAININGPLTGAGSINLGTGNLTLNQATNSTFAGNITGTANVINQSTGTLTLSGTVDFSGTFTGKNGATIVNGTFTTASNVATEATGTLGGSGTIIGSVTTAGTLNPGAASPGTLNTGSINFALDGSLAVDLLGVAVGQADRVAVTGSVDLTGAKLAINAPNPIATGSKFTVIDNDTNFDPVNGTFSNAPIEGDTVTFSGQEFSVSYVGGDGNDVVLTRTASAAPTVLNYTVNNGDVQRSRLTTITVNFSAPVTVAGFTGLGAITLTRTAATAVGIVGTVVQTGAVGANGLITVTQPGPNTSLTLTFSNADASNETFGVEYGSLADGRWQLAIPSAGNFTSILNDVNLRRLFGDFEGAPGSNGTVDAADFGQFGTAFGTTGAPGFSPFDYDDNGTIDSGDLGAFGGRFGFSV